MLDREGYRPNVGIILLNHRNEVWWGKRIREHSWQFPQGGIKHGESPEQAMYRELEEEIGLRAEHVKVIGRTRDWLRYEVPDHFIRREVRGHYRGQKQIWFLLRMVGRDSDINLRMTEQPEFDAWRWHDYWVPLDLVIEFKRDVYHRALQELARFLERKRQFGRPRLRVDQVDGLLLEGSRRRRLVRGAPPQQVELPLDQPVQPDFPAAQPAPVDAASGIPEQESTENRIARRPRRRGSRGGRGRSRLSRSAQGSLFEMTRAEAAQVATTPSSPDDLKKS